MLQVGFGEADITPKVGMGMPGGFSKRPGTGSLSKLLAVACVVHDGARTVALVGIDTVAVLGSTVAEARRLVTESTGIPGDHVLVGASHTHTGGPVLSNAGCDEDPVYTGQVARGVAEAIGSAWHSLHAAEVGIGTGREDSISFNRRFLMRDGREITHPGKPGAPHHGEIVGPAGPIDPDVGVLTARDPSGRITGIVVNFACHSTVIGGTRFSADYAGFLRNHLKARYGAATPVVFLLGPCGDITQVDNMSTAKESGEEYADMMGQKLAAETTRTIDRMTWLKEAPVRADVRKVPLPIRPEPDPVRERPAFGLGMGPVFDEAYAKERLLIAEERRTTPEIPCEVQAIRVGPLGIATNGAEYFCEYGLRIKRCSPLTPTWVVSLANDYIGYVSTAQAFVSGGYEPRTARSSKMSIDTGQRLVEEALQGLNRVAKA